MILWYFYVKRHILSYYSQLPVPTSPLSLQLSAPLPCDSKNFLNTGTYVFDAGYVPPNPKTPSGNNTPKHHSPIGKRISPPLPVLNNSDLDLSKPIPKAGGNVDVGLHNAKKKGYIPMDQSPHTQGKFVIMSHWLLSEHRLSSSLSQSLYISTNTLCFVSAKVYPIVGCSKTWVLLTDSTITHFTWIECICRGITWYLICDLMSL